MDDSALFAAFLVFHMAETGFSRPFTRTHAWKAAGLEANLKRVAGWLGILQPVCAGSDSFSAYTGEFARVSRVDIWVTDFHLWAARRGAL